MKKIIFFWIISIWACGGLQAQTYCSTPDTASDLLQGIPVNQRLTASNNYVVRIYIHVMRLSNGTGGQTQTEVDQALNLLVSDFEAQGICISLLGIDEILNDTYYYYDFFDFGTDSDGDGKFDSFSPNSNANAVDIYLFANDANLQGGLAANIVATSLVVGGNLFGSNIPTSHVLSHELGHCLGLFHTFHGLCEPGCPELVDGTNCTTCGDFVCDTPPDPQTFSFSNCQWNGNTCGVGTVDANGDPYDPQMNLIMAYVPPDCMELFTDGQGERMRTIIANSTLLQNVIVPNSLTVSSLSVGSGATVLYDVLNDLIMQTNVVVSANGTLTLRAGESITLKDVFHAQSSSTFHAYIDADCSTIDQDNSARKITGNIKNVDRETGQKINPFKLYNNGLYVNIFPNPARDKLIISTLSLNSKHFEIKIVSLTGVVVRKMDIQEMSSGMQYLELDISGLSNGVYFVLVSDGIAQISKKLIKLK